MRRNRLFQPLANSIAFMYHSLVSCNKIDCRSTYEPSSFLAPVRPGHGVFVTVFLRPAGRARHHRGAGTINSRRDRAASPPPRPPPPAPPWNPPPPPPPPDPTPTPSPTPTPDPWADKFYPGGAYLSVRDATKGPWIYKDENLSVEINMLRGGPRNRTYYAAEIYTRGPLMTRGFAFQSDKGKTELPYKIARRYDAVLGITADYFNHRGNGKGVILKNEKTYFDKTKNSTLAILPDGGLAVFEPGETTAEQLGKMGVKDTFSFGPILVKDGKVNKKSLDDHWLPVGANEYRAAIGQYEPGHYVVIVTRGAFTMEELANLFVEYGVTLAYNMDGGHSACLIFMGEQLNQQYPGSKDGVRQRPLPDLMMLGFEPTVPDVKDKVYCDGVHVNTKNKPKPTEGAIR